MAPNNTEELKEVTKSSNVVQPKYPFTVHTVSHKMIFDEKYWEPRLKPSATSSQTFSFYMKNLDHSPVSPPFSAEDDGEIFWKVRVTTANNSGTKIMVALDLESKPQHTHVLVYAVLTSNIDSPFKEKDPKTAYMAECSHSTYGGWSAKSKGQSDVVIFNSHTFSEGFKAIRVDITYLKVKRDEPEFVAEELPPETVPFSDVSVLLENPTSSDITVRCGEETWKLHKCILGSRNKVFAAMFNSDMKETLENEVVLDSIDSKALDIMIKFIYTGEVKDLQDLEEELLPLTDLYDIPLLKRKCESKIRSKLKVDNCLHYFRFAEKYNAKLLAAVARRILTFNLLKICKTDEYKEFAKENFELAIEITHDALQRK